MRLPLRRRDHGRCRESLWDRFRRYRRRPVFELSKGSGVVASLASFDGSNGFHPQSKLLIDSAGNLYGTASAGGPDDGGTVFELTKGTGSSQGNTTFDRTNGFLPWGGLIEDSAGNLYGTTNADGPNGLGTIFEVVEDSGGAAHDPGGLPSATFAHESDLAIDSAGNLFGTTMKGGVNDCGSVYELVKGSDVVTIVASFNTTSGSDSVSPSGDVIMDSAGTFMVPRSGAARTVTAQCLRWLRGAVLSPPSQASTGANYSRLWGLVMA